VISGGQSQGSYDPQGRLLTQSIIYNGARVESFKYDALDRIREADYNGDFAAYTYDKLGPLTQAVFNEKGANYAIRYDMYEDGAQKAVHYPSGIALDETRAANGRLL